MSPNCSNKTIILVPLVLILVRLVFKKVRLVFGEFCVVRLVFGSPGFETLNPTLVGTVQGDLATEPSTGSKRVQNQRSN